MASGAVSQSSGGVQNVVTTTNNRRARTKTLPVWGERVALERCARELSQRELAALVTARLGRAVSRDTIVRVERGMRQVPDELRVALADVFEMRPEVLFPYPRLAPVAPAQRARPGASAPVPAPTSTRPPAPRRAPAARAQRSASTTATSSTVEVAEPAVAVA